MLLQHAIASRTCIAATYNMGRVKLAPYILYRKDDALFVDAVTLERAGQAPRELKIGAFRLAGLRDVALLPEPFHPIADLAIDPARYAGGILSSLRA